MSGTISGTGPTTIGYTGDIVTYTVATTGLYDIDAIGASGGTAGDPPGLGANVSGDVMLTAGETLMVAVGGEGSSYGGGGGGTFVAVVSAGTEAPLVVAGGGGANVGDGADAAGGIDDTGTGSGGSGGGQFLTQAAAAAAGSVATVRRVLPGRLTVHMHLVMQAVAAVSRF